MERILALALTMTLSTPRREAQLSLLWQLEYRPVLVRWSQPNERGFLFKFLFLAVCYRSDRQ